PLFERSPGCHFRALPEQSPQWLDSAMSPKSSAPSVPGNSPSASGRKSAKTASSSGPPLSPTHGSSPSSRSSSSCCHSSPISPPSCTLRPIAVLLTIVVATLIIAGLILLPVGTALTHFIQKRNIQLVSKGTLILWNIARYTLALVLMLMVLAIVYYFGPRVR